MNNPTLCCWCDNEASHVLVSLSYDGLTTWKDPACPKHVVVYLDGYELWEPIPLAP